VHIVRIVVFWSAFIIACGVLLPRYYAARQSTHRIAELRITTLATELLVLLSLVLPWIPKSRGGPVTGLSLMMSGDGLVIATVLCICTALLLFVIARTSLFLKIASAAHLLATPLFFAAILRLAPGTFAMTLADIAPVVAVLLLLCGDVTALFLWHRLQREKTIDWTARSITIAGSVALSVLLVVGFFSVMKLNSAPPTSDRMDAATTSSVHGVFPSADDAVNIVRKLPAVINYVERVPGAIINVDHEEDNTYVIHVYEVTSGHTATFNWYMVDRTTGEVTAMFDISSLDVTAQQDEWVLYRNPSHGYTFWYPSRWILDATDEAGPTVRVNAPDEDATFAVSSLVDERLTQKSGLDAVFADIRAGFAQDKRYVIADYEQGAETGLLAGVYITHGGFADGGVEYRFKEMGILLRDGRIFVKSVHVEKPSVSLYSNILDEMMSAFDPFGTKSEKPKMAW